MKMSNVRITSTCRVLIIEYDNDQIAPFPAARQLQAKLVGRRCLLCWSSPPLRYGGRHGDDEQHVFEELCQIVEETIELYHQDGKPLPPPTSGREFANKLQDVA